VDGHQDCKAAEECEQRLGRGPRGYANQRVVVQPGKYYGEPHDIAGGVQAGELHREDKNGRRFFRLDGGEQTYFRGRHAILDTAG
jgi:hypothetical protein